MHGAGRSTSAIAFRPLCTDDFPALLRWLSAPHVRPWFPDGPQTLQGIEQKYGSRTAEGSQVHVTIATYETTDIGFLQHYLVDDLPEYLTATAAAGAAGIDFVIGDGNYVGRGLGPVLISAYITDIVRAQHPSVKHIVSSPHPDNLRSIRALQKAGFIIGREVEFRGTPELLCMLSLC